MKPTQGKQPPASVGELTPPPEWVAKKVEDIRNLSDVRREQVAVYWLWRRYAMLTVGNMATAVQALRVIGATMEAERDTRVAELEAKVRMLEEELEQRAVQPEMARWAELPHNAKPI